MRRRTSSNPRASPYGSPTAVPSGLPTGVGAVLTAVSDLLAFRLTGTKFKVPLLLSHLLDEFRTKVLKRFAGAAQGPAEYRLRICPAGQGEKLEKAVDSGARIREGSLTLSSYVLPDPPRARRGG